jgi:hypothetical protein
MRIFNFEFLPLAKTHGFIATGVHAATLRAQPDVHAAFYSFVWDVVFVNYW